MPDPWGGDNMSEEYAGAMLADLKKRRQTVAKGNVPAEEPVKKSRPRLPPGWTWDDNDGPLPKIFNEVQQMMGRVQVQPRPELPGYDAKEAAVEAFRDVVHVAFNTACRLCGVEVEGRASEVSWEATSGLGGMLGTWIESGWRDQELSRELKVKEYHEAKAKAARLAKELGLSDEETS
jgi:hypothetical protein